MASDEKIRADNACAALLIEIAFLLPRGTNIQTHSVGVALKAYVAAVRAEGVREGPEKAAVESDEAWMQRVYPHHGWTPADGIPYAAFCRRSRAT